MAIAHPIPVDALRQLLRLDPETGRLYWLPRGIEWFRDDRVNTADQIRRSWNTKHAGKEAFTNNDGRGYRQGLIFRKSYKAHRVVFALHHGRWPVVAIDHRDCDGRNNRPDNLREATPRQNVQNRRSTRGSKSRYCGVSWHAKRGKWRAECKGAQGEGSYIGLFATEEEAALAYDEAARIRHGEFANLNFPAGH